MSDLTRYALGELLGRGGMGDVYRAHDTLLHRDVAIKLVRTRAPEDRGRVIREARAAAAIDHPNAVVIYDVADDGAFIVMELLAGKTLLDAAATEPSIDTRLGWLRDVAAALAAAHARGLVHRDVKPGNILICDDGNPKVLDFGIAKRKGLQPILPGDSLTGIDTASIAGTPAYMAPEQRDGEIDARSDQYSWAVTACEVLTGARPASPAEATLPPDVPPRVAAAITRALERDPEARWPAMRDVVREIDGDEPPGQPRRVPWRVIAGGLAGLAAVGGGALVYRIATTRAPAPVVTARTPRNVFAHDASQHCRIDRTIAVVGATRDATLDLATCDARIVVAATPRSGLAVWGTTDFAGPLVLLPPTGLAAGAQGAFAVCDRGRPWLLFHHYYPDVPIAASPLEIGLVEPGDDCRDPGHFCSTGYPVGPIDRCALALDFPPTESVVACPATNGVRVFQFGVPSGRPDLQLASAPVARIAGAVHRVDDAAVFVLRDTTRIRVGWFPLTRVPRYETIAEGEVGEPAIASLTNDFFVSDVDFKYDHRQGIYTLIVWPEHIAQRWVLRAARAEAETFTPEPIPHVAASPAAPAIARFAGGVAIAWLDGDGALWLGAGRILADALAHPAIVATQAAAPVLAGDDRHLALAWVSRSAAPLSRDTRLLANVICGDD